MKAMILIGGFVALAAAVVLVGCQKAGESAAPAAGAVEPSVAASAMEKPAQKFCPVAGDPIDPNTYVDHEGRRIYFCCPMCIDTFKQDPAKYVKKVDEELSGGPASATEPHEH